MTAATDEAPGRQVVTASSHGGGRNRFAAVALAVALMAGGACGSDDDALPADLAEYQTDLQAQVDELIPALIDGFEANSSIRRVDVLTYDATDTTDSGRLSIAATTTFVTADANADVAWAMVTAIADASEPGTSHDDWRGTTVELDLSGHRFECSPEFMRALNARSKARSDFNVECAT